MKGCCCASRRPRRSASAIRSSRLARAHTALGATMDAHHGLLDPVKSVKSVKSVKRAKRVSLGAGALALAFIGLHLPFLPASLEDLDSINFALGIRDFDVARHQPHPPGYPIFILAAKAVHAVVPSEARALSVVGVGVGGLAALALARLFRTLEATRSAEDAGLLATAPSAADARPLAATLLALTSPLFWMTAARPLSDAAGLAAALAVDR